MKPDYLVPDMAEIHALPWNGLRVASLFAGGGGSSLGYRMAGFRVGYALEFVPEARDTYRANAHPDTVVDDRDIRNVRPEEILDALRLGAGDLDVLDGSPPCSPFSTAGRRDQKWNKVSRYSDTEQRSDDLFFEFVRILAGVRPKVFVAENVSGLVKGRSQGYFIEIMKALKGVGYRVRAELLDAQWLGVPQARERLIFVGVRADLNRDPVFPTPLPYRYGIEDAIPWLRGEGLTPLIEPETDISRFAIGEKWRGLYPGESVYYGGRLWRPDPRLPAPTITATCGAPSAASVAHPSECRKFSIAELRRLCSFPDDFFMTGTYGQRAERLGRAVPPVMMSHVAATVRDKILGGV